MRLIGVMLVLSIAVWAFAAPDIDYKAMRDADKVTRYLKSDDTAFFESGKLQNGTAVYDPERDLAFWVDGNKIYVVNARAKQAAPDLPQAPAEITYDAIYEATCTDPLAWEVRPAEIATSADDMSPEEVQKLEEAVLAQPSDIWARTRLLGYYSLPQYDDDEARKNYERHVLWLVENAPESAVLGCEADLDPDLNPDAYARAEKLMKDHVKKDPQNLRLLFVASEFFNVSDTPYAIECLKKCIEIEPENPRWHEKLAFTYSLEAEDVNCDDGTVTVNPEAARNALLAQERALVLNTDEQDRVRLLTRLAEAAFQAGDLEKAKTYAAELLEKVKTASLWDRPGAVHTANTILGRAAVKEGDIAKAKEYLIASGKCGSSPQLSSFGPSMDLAVDLLQKGERDAVIQYLQLCGDFWNKRIADGWIGQIKGGNDLQMNALIEEMKSGEAGMEGMIESMQLYKEAGYMNDTPSLNESLDRLQNELPSRNWQTPLITLPLREPLTKKLDALYGIPLLLLLGIVLSIRLASSRQHLWILAPLLSIYLVSLGALKIFPQLSNGMWGLSVESLQHLLATYSGCLALVCLVSDLLARMKWWARVPAAALVMGVAGLMGAVNYPLRYHIVSEVSAFIIVVIVGSAVAGLCCSRRYSWWKFLAFLFVFDVIFMVIAWPCLLACRLLVAFGLSLSEMWEYIPANLLMAVVDGVGLFLLLIPFFLMASLVPLYKEQFRRILNLPQK